MSLIIKDIPNEGFVGAGRMIAFPGIKTSIAMPVTSKQADMVNNGQIRALTVSGDSLNGIGLYDGDRILCKKVYSKKEIGPQTVCTIYIPSTGEVVAKRIRFVGNDIILRSCHPNVGDMVFHPDEIDIRGVVIALYREPDIAGRFDRDYEEEIPV